MARKRAGDPLDLVMSVDGKIIQSKAQGVHHVRSLLEADAVDEFHLTFQPVIMGGGLPSLTGIPEGFLPRERLFRLKSLVEECGMARIHYVRDRRKKSSAQLIK